MFDRDNQTQNNNLVQLNAALAGVVPALLPAPPYNLANFPTPGANTAMLDAVIEASNFNLYDYLTFADLQLLVQGLLADGVNTHPIEFHYATHGDRHFPAGRAGSTKFNHTQLVRATTQIINPLLIELINPHRGRIRRDAAGNDRSYYLTDREKPWTKTNGPNLCIQADYFFQPERIVFHGYPDSVQVFCLSRHKGGASIPP